MSDVWHSTVIHIIKVHLCFCIALWDFISVLYCFKTWLQNNAQCIVLLRSRRAIMLCIVSNYELFWTQRMNTVIFLIACLKWNLEINKRKKEKATICLEKIAWAPHSHLLLCSVDWFLFSRVCIIGINLFKWYRQLDSILEILLIPEKRIVV